ncbi:MAG: hypothetical protein LC792_06160 [Actinobacteria bacterium]|nr:hypothetical protein [Actinomycetota bacterium]
MRRRLLPLLAGVAAALSTAPAVADGPRLPALGRLAAVVPYAAAVTSNWSGYAATGRRFSSVSASWRQPDVPCAPGESSTAGFWVGLDGVASPTVEQIGTFIRCIDGARLSVGFFEAYPKLPGAIPQTVAPGDVVSASVSSAGRRRFNLAMTDETAGWTFTMPVRVAKAQQSSAEIIAEAALDVGTGALAPLTNFGVVGFDQATVDGVPLPSAAPDAVLMAAADGTLKAEPSALSPDGSFSVTWHGP